MRQVFRILALVTIVIGLASTPAFANALNYTGTWANGSVAIPFTVATAGTIDFQTAAGTYDPMIALFDAAGGFIIAADDELGPPDPDSYQAHLTRSLVAGDYFLLVSDWEVLISPIYVSATSVNTDGLNLGTYYINSSATLASAQADVLATVTSPNHQGYAARPYNVTISTNDGLINGSGAEVPVPEPTSMLLVGSGLALAQIRRARRRKN